MHHTQTQKSIEAYSERVRQRYARKIYERELRSGNAPSSVQEASTTAGAIAVLGNLKGKDAQQAAAAIDNSADPIADLRHAIQQLDEQSLNYLYASTSYTYFCSKYLPKPFSRGFTPLYHDVYFDMCRKVETHAIATPVAVAGPRDFGKSTIGNMMLPLHCCIFPVNVFYPDGSVRDISKRYIAHVSIVEAAAIRQLETICEHLETNKAIRDDFGEFYKDPDGPRIMGRKLWNKRVAVTLNNKRFEVFGRKGKIRGALWSGTRPDLVIGDDLEDDENVESVSRQDRDFKWFTRVVAPCIASENGNVLVLGNLVNPNGLVDRLIKYGREVGWLTKVFRFYEIDPDTGDKVYTWPEYFDDAMEKVKREISQDEGFEVEYLQNPDAQLRELKPENFQRYTLSSIQDQLHHMFVFAAIDPASTVSRRSDFSCIAGIAYDPRTKHIYVLPCVIGRIPLRVQASAVLDYHSKWNAVRFGAETVQYQVALKSDIEELARKDGVYIVMEGIQHANMGAKRARIGARLFSRIASGVIRFLDNDPGTEILIQQLINLKHTQYDDAADALEMAVRMRDDYARDGHQRKRGKIRAAVC